MPHEFRVRWQRGDRQPTTRIYQGWSPAYRKMTGLQALDAVKAETVKFQDMPSLACKPVLEFREVGPWQPHDQQPDAEEIHIENMRRWVVENYEPIPEQPVGEFPF